MKNHASSLVTKVAKLLLGLAACSAVTVVVYAAVVFDPQTGTGFVGKGDVQDAFGWNNQHLQQHAADVRFSLHTTSVVVQECVDNLGQGQTVFMGLRQRTTVLGSSVAYDARRNSSGKNGDVTGFLLTGFSGPTIVIDQQTGGWIGPNGETAGSGCPAGSHPRGAPWELPADLNGTELYASYGNSAVCIWVPQPAL